MEYIQNLCAFLLPFFTFLFFSCVGLATLSLFHSKKNSIQNLLIAPGVGLSVAVLFIFLPNWYGLPIEKFSYALLVFLLIASVSVLYIKKPLLPIKKILPFLIIVIIALFLVGRPLLFYGFNWLSFANDDMTNYILGASWFLHHGYYDVPKIQSITEFRDYSAFYWFWYLWGLSRSGSELLLAWVAAVTQLKTLQIFMPVIVSCYLSIVTGIGALIYRNRRYYKPAIWGCFVASITSLIALGTFYQLIAQIVGIAILIPIVLLGFTYYKNFSFKRLSKNAILVSLLAAALIVSYPEISPFLILGYCLFFLLSFIKQGISDKKYLIWLLILTIAVVLLSGSYFLTYVGYILHQSHGGLATGNNSLFSYYLVPEGLAYFWGLQAIGSKTNYLLMNVMIAFGIALFSITFVLCYYMIRRVYAPAIILLIMFVVAFLLFYTNSGFGLFKLAMYMQPFLIATVVVAIADLFQEKKIKVHRKWILPLVVLLAANVLTQNYYLERSYGSSAGSFAILPFASQNKFVQQLSSYNKSFHEHNYTNIYIASDNLLVQKLLLLYSKDFDTRILSRNFYLHFTNDAYSIFKDFKLHNLVNQFQSGLLDNAKIRKDELNKEFKQYNFVIDKNSIDKFTSIIQPNSKNEIYIFDPPKSSILNRWQLNNDSDKNSDILLLSNKSRDLLIYVNSSLGQNYYLGDLKVISLYQLQQDSFYPQDTFAPTGRYLLFQLFNPDDKVRMILNMSTTLNPGKHVRLPHALVIGNERVPFPVMGMGSARVISDPVMPQIIGDHPYLMLDMNAEGKKYPRRELGLMGLYGRDVDSDYRVLTSYARDISLMSEKQYEAMKRPDLLNQFPQDLANPNLEYSGIYEDGWVAEEAYVNLSQPYSKAMLVIKGLIPEINNKLNYNSDLNIFLNDKKIAEKNLKVGYFSIEIPVLQISKLDQIKLTFNNAQILPNGDKRIVSAKLISIGFVAT